MNIGIDIDNTITNTMVVYQKLAHEYNENVLKQKREMGNSFQDISNLYHWTKTEELDFFHTYFDEGIKNVTVKENAREMIQKLKDEGNTITIITARRRPYFSDPESLCKNYLDSHHIYYDKLVTSCVDKNTYCIQNHIDIMIDDEERQIRSISKRRPVIVLTGIQNQHVNGKNIYHVNNWNEVYAKIKEITC